MRTALLSAFNKEGVVEAARRLLALGGWQILASGGTAKAITAAGISVRDIASLVGEPILGHRVVTLSREIHAGLLAQDNPADRAELERIGAPFIDFLYVDLYPLKETIAQPGVTLEQVLEVTDIGGPCMLRSAAKGRRMVVTDISGLVDIINWIESGEDLILGTDRDEVIAQLCMNAERRVADYVSVSARWLADHDYYPKRAARQAAESTK